METACGAAQLEKEPSPISPFKSPRPQQYASPALVKAQAYVPPELTDVIAAQGGDTTSTGTADLSTRLLFPSTPRWFHPQQNALPELFTAHVKYSPGLISVKPASVALALLPVLTSVAHTISRPSPTRAITEVKGFIGVPHNR